MTDYKALIAEAREWRERALPPTPWGDKHVVNRLAAALEAATVALAVDREALAAELYTAYTAKGWHRADEIERSDWRLVAQEVIDAGILRDVRDVQAEGADLAADWLAEQLWPDAADYAGHVRQFAQAIREARNERD